MQDRVLLVTRERDVGDLYGAILASQGGARSVWVPDAAAARRFVTNGMQFHAILFDVTLPSEWDGCEKLARSAGAPPVVVITGWFSHDGRFRRKAFDCGCAAFIRKPCQPQTLIEALRQVRQGTSGLEIL